VLVQALTTGHKIGLGVVAAVFIAFALASAFLFPRFRSSFPGRGLPAFIVVAFVFFLGMLTAVEVFGAEKKEPGEEHAAESTTEPTTTEQPQSTSTVALPAPTTTTTPKPKPKPQPAPKPQTVAVTETEFKIALPSAQLKAGPVTFDVKNAGQIEHDLVITGNGLTEGTPRFNGGQSKTLKVTLKPGTYELFCSVPGHKQAGMDLKVTVGS
jgi:outer membrane biosynthesis protein TonB